MSEEHLSTLRAAIDDADAILMNALAARLRVVEVLAEVKRAAGIPPVDPEREAVLLAAWKSRAAKAGVPLDLAEGILAQLLRRTRAVVSGTSRSSESVPSRPAVDGGDEPT